MCNQLKYFPNNLFSHSLALSRVSINKWNSRMAILSLNSISALSNAHSALRPSTLLVRNIAMIVLLISLLLLTSGNVERNPGPALADQFPCGRCELNVDWSQLAVCCDECDHWYHKTCISMTSIEYDDVSDESWICTKCKTVNCSSFQYQCYNLNVSNSFEALVGVNNNNNNNFYLYSAIKSNQSNCSVALYNE